MKLTILFLLAAGPMFGQTANVAAVGVSVNPGATPAVAGTGSARASTALSGENPGASRNVYGEN